MNVRKHNGVLVAPAAVFNYDMKQYPGGKCILLTDYGIAVIGQSSPPHVGYRAWAPLPDRDKVKEKELGIL